MGLDMYIFKHNKNSKQVYNTEYDCWEYPDQEEVAYWRKANAIHNFFLDSLNLPRDFNCDYAEVDASFLEELIDICELVLGRKDKNDGIKIAEQHLPTLGGFFFGDTDYDEWYYDDVEDTIKQIKKVLEETDWENEVLEYYVSW